MSDAMPALTKTCGKCGEIKPLDEYHRQPTGVLGRKWECKDCYREYYKEWYAKNRERVLEYHRRRNAANPEANRAKVKAWREANPDRVRANAQQGKRARRQRETSARVESIDYEAIWVTQRGRCAMCGDLMDPFAPGPDPLSKSIDHIIPLAKGGLTTQDNLQFLHLRCNALKSVTLPEESESA